MKLDDTQKQRVSEWIEQGLKLSEIQDKLDKELGIRMTYMEVRFLIDDLGVKLKEKEAPAPAPAPAATPAQPGAASKPGATTPLEQSETAPASNRAPTPRLEKSETAGAAGGVSVSVDQVTRPGALVSGKVTFSDGKSADWYLDQMGRLGLAPKEQGYKPSENDLMEFQMELQNELSRLGL